MGILAAEADARVRDVLFDEATMSVELMDGHTITVPLAWQPRLLDATRPDDRGNRQIAGTGYGLHWPRLDEDLSAEGLLRGVPAGPRPTA